MAVSRFYSSVAQQTTLTASITPSSTVIAVAATTGFPGSTPFVLAIDYGGAGEELVDVTGIGGLNLTVTRAVDGTSAASHNSGAIVRHVSSARDFSDSRTHEAATANVHGVTGAGNDLVGTSSTQTLTNKTLTSPVINGGSQTGTISGTHTYSGATTFSAAANLNAGGAMAGTFSGSPTFSGTVTHSGVTNINGGGALAGTFSGSPTFSGTPTFALGANSTDFGLRSSRTLNTDLAFTAFVTGDTINRYSVNADGLTQWGSGSAARDTNLYRSAANVLKTDDSFTVGGNLSVSGVGQRLFAYKTADTARTAIFTTDDPHLTFTLDGSSVYTMEGMIFFSTSNNANDIAIDFTTPASAAGQWMGIGQPTSATDDAGVVRTMTSAVDATRNYGATTDTSNKLGISLRAIIDTSAGGGTYALSWGLVTAGATVTLYQYSWMRLTKEA